MASDRTWAGLSRRDQDGQMPARPCAMVWYRLFREPSPYSQISSWRFGPPMAVSPNPSAAWQSKHWPVSAKTLPPRAAATGSACLCSISRTNSITSVIWPGVSGVTL